MIRSMTGYGCAKSTSGDIAITIEVRSVNNRFLDCSVKIPRSYISMEESLKSLVQKHISRGKVDVFVTLDTSGADDLAVTVNEHLAASYLAAIASLSEKFDIKNDLTASSLSRYPDVLSVEKKEADADVLQQALCACLDEALTGYDTMRAVEGQKLFDDITTRLNTIESLTAKAEERSPKTVAEYRGRLEQRIREVLENSDIDEGRLLTEVAIFADRVAVNEELVRLKSHISQLRDMILSDEPVGRKLDFLVQELNREANTLGSKGNDVEMARIVVDIKAEIEKIREQIQNVE